MEKINCTTCGKDNLTNSKYCCSCGFELPKTKIENVEVKFLRTSTEKKDNRKMILNKVILGIIFAASCIGLVQFYFSPPSFDKAMLEIASEMNKVCPLMVNKDTRLDNAVALPDNIFQYNYTLLNSELSEINVDTVKKYTEPGIINNVKTNPDLKLFRDHKTTLNYYYRDKKGDFVFKLSVTPDRYE